MRINVPSGEDASVLGSRPNSNFVSARMSPTDSACSDAAAEEDRRREALVSNHVGRRLEGTGKERLTVKGQGDSLELGGELRSVHLDD